ncbi:putative spermatogenesis-associated protein 5-like [Penaeus vannamei]|uniref:Putative spermatogenesis-associated protein 5-like n=1 Tax=Penaeus vannamei TaxID=6689 RepID=A0A423SDH3_PENVA|nr:putative spermatogenesis-associated protein 5-like [Penaeus vannamei]
MSTKTKCSEKGEKKSQKKNARKRTKDSGNESLNSTLQPEITAKVVLIPKEMLQDKTLEGISRVHSLTVCIKGLAEQKGFLNHQFVTLTTKGETLPAHLLIDSKIKENVAIIKDETSKSLCEGEDVIISSQCSRLFAEEIEDVKSKFLGETEQNLKKMFDKAVDRAPCILFIDDIDILCSSRDRKGSTGIVTALLHLMDGVTGNSSRGVLVVATASDPKSLDAALRRPGRLSQDVCLQAPTEVDRKDIFEKLLYRVPSDLTDSDLHILAASTPGYVGGDLRRVIMEAIVQADGKAIDREMIQTAITAVRPAALLASNTVDREVQLSDIHGYGQLKHHLQESVNLTLCHSAIFQDCGISPPSRFFLFGPPGCGKTSLVMAIATKFHLNVIPVKRSTVLGKYFGESEQNLAKVFQKVM